jgi:hypothetical protein
MKRFAWRRSGVMLGGLWFLTACAAPSPRPEAAVPSKPAPERAAAPTPPPATPGPETAQLRPSVPAGASLPETFESEDFVVTFAKAGATAAGLAARFLGDVGKAWMVEDYNGGAAFEPGHEVVIPKRPWNLSGVGPTGYQIVPILVYHNLGPQSKGRLTIGVATFEEQMRYLKTQGYRVISLNDFLAFASLRRQLPRKSVVLTFDDGWKPFREFAYPLPKELGFTATLFIYSDFVGSRSALSWDEIRQLGQEGFQIEAHSKTHSDLRRRQGESEAEYVQRMPDPRISLWGSGRRRAEARQGTRICRGLHRATPGRSVVRAAPHHPPKPDLFGHESRGVREEPERVQRGTDSVTAGSAQRLVAVGMPVRHRTRAWMS